MNGGLLICAVIKVASGEDACLGVAVYFRNQWYFTFVEPPAYVMNQLLEHDDSQITGTSGRTQHHFTRQPNQALPFSLALLWNQSRWLSVRPTRPCADI